MDKRCTIFDRLLDDKVYRFDKDEREGDSEPGESLLLGHEPAIAIFMAVSAAVAARSHAAQGWTSLVRASLTKELTSLHLNLVTMVDVFIRQSYIVVGWCAG